MNLTKNKTPRILSTTFIYALIGWFLYSLNPSSISLTTPIPENLPFEHTSHQNSVVFEKSYLDKEVRITVSKPKDYFFILILLLSYISTLCSITHPQKQPLHPLSALPVDSIKNHPLYETFIDENEERMHLYKDDLPAEFSVWLIAHTAKSEN